MLKWSRLRVRMEYVEPENLCKTFSTQYIVDQFHNQPSGLLKTLCEQQSKGSLILSRLAWCEAVLQRFPPELLSREDLLAGRFFVAKGTFQARLKRVGDVVVALTLLIVTSPLVLISSLLIKSSDRGLFLFSGTQWTG